MKYFGTDGFRGEANVGLFAYHAYRIGRFLGNYYLKGFQPSKQEPRPRIVIGKDTRRSSYMLENALAAGITVSGSDAYLLHVTTTPSVSYCVSSEDFACGIMISASHNPFYDNGIKLIGSEGTKMEESILEEIEEYIDRPSDDLPYAVRDRIGEVRDFVLGRNRYIGYLISTVRRSFKEMKIGLDCANGASFTIAKNVFDALGAETYVINDRPDGLNINKNAGSTHIEALVKFVKENNLDAGFAFDGDADRCIAVDNKGEVVDGDVIMYIAAMDMKERGALRGNTVVTTVMSNFGLYKALEEAGIDYVQTQVGDKYVAAEMRKNAYMIGGEQSGHVIFGKYATTGDGILTALRICEIMADKKTDLASLHQNLKIYPQKKISLRVKDKNSILENENVRKRIKEVDERLGDSGRTLVRPSGTEPVIRIMAEHLDEEECSKAVDDIIDAIRTEGLLNQY